MENPLVRGDGMEAVGGQVGAFTDTHAGVALQKKNRTGQIFAIGEFRLNQLVLFWREWARRFFLAARNVFAGEEAEQRNDLMGPSQMIEQAGKTNDANGNGDFGHGRNTGAQLGEPAEDMRFASQLIQAADVGVMSSEVAQKPPIGRFVSSPGSLAQGDG